MGFMIFTGVVALFLMFVMVNAFYDDLELSKKKDAIMTVLAMCLIGIWVVVVEVNYRAIVYIEDGDIIMYNDSLFGAVKDRLFIINGDTIPSDSINKVVSK